MNVKKLSITAQCYTSKTANIDFIRTRTITEWLTLWYNAYPCRVIDRILSSVHGTIEDAVASLTKLSTFDTQKCNRRHLIVYGGLFFYMYSFALAASACDVVCKCCLIK